MEEFRKRLKKVGLNQTGLKDSIVSITNTYLEVAKIAEDIIKRAYKDEKANFPIDIMMVAQYLGIEVTKENLNQNIEMRFSRILGRIVAASGKAHIIVDNSVSYKTQRYAIANAIGRCLLNEDEMIFESSYAIPLMPQSLEEIAADVIALFLLFPVDTFKSEFAAYLEQCKDYPLDVDAWLQHLSDVSQVTMFNLAIGYQQLKQVLCCQRQMKFKDNGYDIAKMENDPYDIIFA